MSITHQQTTSQRQTPENLEPTKLLPDESGSIGKAEILLLACLKRPAMVADLRQFPFYKFQTLASLIQQDFVKRDEVGILSATKKGLGVLLKFR
ncbi:MAG TPA: hypothetical protein V6D29_24085 [Leptolyngbyaceae cyanobacterium]